MCRFLSAGCPVMLPGILSCSHHIALVTTSWHVHAQLDLVISPYMYTELPGSSSCTWPGLGLWSMVVTYCDCAVSVHWALYFVGTTNKQFHHDFGSKGNRSPGLCLLFTPVLQVITLYYWWWTHPVLQVSTLLMMMDMSCTAGKHSINDDGHVLYYR